MHLRLMIHMALLTCISFHLNIYYLTSTMNEIWLQKLHPTGF